MLEKKKTLLYTHPHNFVYNFRGSWICKESAMDLNLRTSALKTLIPPKPFTKE